MAEGRTTPEGWWVPPSDDETSPDDTPTATAGPMAQVEPVTREVQPPEQAVPVPVPSPVPVASPAAVAGPDLTWVGSTHVDPGTAKRWPGLATWQAAQTPGEPLADHAPGSIPSPLGTPQDTTDPTQPAVLAPSTGTNPFATRGATVLVLSILGAVLSVTCVGGLFAPVAWIMGNGVRKDARSTGWPEPRKNKTGRIVAMFGTVLGVLAVLMLVAYAVSNVSSTT